MTDAQAILQAITLAVTGWILLEVIGQKTSIAAIKQKLADLPCQNCNQKKKCMNAQQLQSIIRAILLSGGTYLVTKGITDEATWTAVVGFITGLVPLIWSWMRHAQPPGSLPSSPSKLPGALLLLFLAFSLQPLAFTSCSTAPANTYKAAATVQVSVDTAMSAWGAYVAAYHPPVAQEQAVKSAYEKYQKAFALACDAGAAYAAASVTNSAGASPYLLALQNAEYNASQDLADLTALITTFGVKLSP